LLARSEGLLEELFDISIRISPGDCEALRWY